MRLALEFESKIGHTKPTRNLILEPAFKSNSLSASQSSTLFHGSTPRIFEAEEQGSYLHGECFKCGDKYAPGHRCKVTFKLLESGEEAEDIEPDSAPVTECDTPNNAEIAEISLHAIPEFKLTTQLVSPFDVQIGKRNHNSGLESVIKLSSRWGLDAKNEIARPSQSCLARVYEAGQTTIEWLIAWHNFRIFDLRTSRLSGRDVLIGTRFASISVRVNGSSHIFKFPLKLFNSREINGGKVVGKFLISFS
ncbi:hypothetical protein Hanom_Chr14g01284361 [Helianthus anomalus]